jgi:Zn-dependent M28 family amino/carboxypeptidase
MKKLQLLVLAFSMLFGVIYISKTEKPDEIKENKKTPILASNVYDSLKTGLFKISVDSTKETVEYLTSDKLEGRMSGKDGNVLAAEFIKKQFESFGYKTKYQKFRIERINSGPHKEKGDDFTKNIIAWSEGKDEVLKNEIIVVGAHMDHIGYGPKMSMQSKIAIHPGADDNASGTAVLLEIAKAMSNVENKRTLVFIAFSAEEMGLLGSRYYVSNPEFPEIKPDIKKHIFMLNMDMVGYLRNGKLPIGFADVNSSTQVNKYIKELNERYDFARMITSRTTGGSDHASFYNKKVPIAFLHTGGHNYYHTPQDTAEKLNYEGMVSISKYATELIWKISQETKKPVFNSEEFKEMPYDHDHGIKEF